MTEETPIYDHIVARHISIAGSDGRERMSLGVNGAEGDAPYIYFINSSGNPGAAVQLDADGRAMFVLLDDSGNWRASLRVNERGDPDLSLFEAGSESPRMSLMLESDVQGSDGDRYPGRAELLVNGTDGSPRAQLFVTNDNDGDLYLLNSDEEGMSLGPPKGKSIR